MQLTTNQPSPTIKFVGPQLNANSSQLSSTPKALADALMGRSLVSEPTMRPESGTEPALQWKRSDTDALDPNDEQEEKLTATIRQLLSEQVERASTAKRTKAELKTIRKQLGAELFALKEHLACAGRNGRWTGFLASVRISRSSADRYVAEHRASASPELLNGTTGAVSVATEQSVEQLVKQVAPKLLKALKTSTAITEFVDLLRLTLESSISEESVS